MNYINFTSNDKRFSLALPDDWSEYDDGEENTHAFFNTIKWTGNFRITYFHWPNNQDKSKNKAEEYFEEETAENIGSVKVKLGDWECVHYKKDIIQADDNLVI